MTIPIKNSGDTLSAAEINALNKKATPKTETISALQSLRIGTNANMVYSDASIGNLGSNFTITFLVSLDLVYANPPTILKKGDPDVDGWGFVVVSEILYLRIKGVDFAIDSTTRNKEYNFLSLKSDATKTELLVNGYNLATFTDTTDIETALTVSAALRRTIRIPYISINNNPLPDSSINDEIESILGGLALPQRTFIGYSGNVTTTGWTDSEQSIIGLAGVLETVDLSAYDYKYLNRFTSTKYLDKYMQLYYNKLKLFATATNQKIFLSEEILVTGKAVVKIFNAWGNKYSYYIFLDSGFNIITTGQSGTSTVIDSTIAEVEIAVPEEAVYWQGNLRLNSTIELIEKAVVQNPYIEPVVYGENNLGLSAILPCLFPGYETIYSTNVIFGAAPIPVLSQDANSVTVDASYDGIITLNKTFTMVCLTDGGEYKNVQIVRQSSGLITILGGKSFTATYISDIGFESGGHMHLSDYAARVCGTNLVASLESEANYRGLKRAGFGCIDFSQAGHINQDGYGILVDEYNKPAFSYSSDYPILSRGDSNAPESWWGCAGFPMAIKVFPTGATTGDNIFTLSQKSPLRSAIYDIRAIAPQQDYSGNIISVAVTVNVYNNEVLVHTETLSHYKLSRILIDRDDWGNVRIEFLAAADGDVTFLFKSVFAYESSPHFFTDPITADSVVAWLGDSWTYTSEDDATDYDPLYTNIEGVESTHTGQAPLPRQLTDLTGCELELWGQGTKDAKWALENQIFNLIHRKKYTHVVIEYFTNDASTLGDKWVGYINLLVKILIANGIRPIVFSPTSLGQYKKIEILDKYVI